MHLPENILGVAMRIKYFGEGAERIVRRFSLVDKMNNVVGKRMVAKESRFIEEVNNVDLKQFHQVFCRTQLKAQSFAEEFNRRLAGIPVLAADTPRVSFLSCAVYMVNDIGSGRIGLLVEDMLDQTKYMKWNNNAGFVHGQEACPPAPIINPLASGLALGPLATLAEEDEEESDSCGSDSDVCSASAFQEEAA
eukprot:scaffold307385_cov43-Prasinocladus_malaysianus.AAC.1